MQWLAVGPPFLSNTIAFDHIKYWHKERFGWGLIFLNDRSGNVPLLVNQIRPSFAYHKSFGKHLVSLGIQPGWTFKSYDAFLTSFPSQFDRNTGGFNRQLPSGDAISFLNLNYFDFSSGINYRFKGDKSSFRIGYSNFHLNRPIESFFGDIRLATRHSVQSVLSLNEDTYYSIDFVLFHNQQNKASESLIGMYNHFGLEDELFAGALYRHGFLRNTDAFILVFGVNLGPFTAAYSFDMTVSEFRQSNNFRGASELSLIYVHPSSIIPRKAIPCERY